MMEFRQEKNCEVNKSRRRVAFYGATHLYRWFVCIIEVLMTPTDVFRQANATNFVTVALLITVAAAADALRSLHFNIITRRRV